MPRARLGRICRERATVVFVNMPTYRKAIAVNEDSANLTSARAARKSRFTNPWLLNIIASGGPEIVVTA